MKYRGTPVSAGVVIGKVYLYRRFVPEVPEHPAGDAAAELQSYLAARQAAREELEGLSRRFAAAGDSEKAAIFSAHLEILLDETMDEEIRGGIAGGGSAAGTAHDVFEQYAALFEGLKDPIIRERGADLRDVSGRLLRCMAGEPERNLSALPEPVIVVASDLTPSDTATLDRTNVLGIVTEVGGTTSHSAIIARSYEIPALLGVSGITSALQNGQEIVLDAADGVLLTEFTDSDRAAYGKKREELLRRQARARTYLGREAVTPDGVRIAVELNIASADAQSLEYARYTDGVGLFRSEFLYMGRSTLPTEEEQFQAYRRVLLTYGDRPVTLRTLDVGGDKPLGCMQLPREDNPFLGNRALRLCLEHPDLFRTQLRAALRASIYGNLWLMFPMVSSMDDIRRAKACVARAEAELTAEGIPFNPKRKLGIMVEIPAIALLADQAAQEVDFASIGTNDLTQYATAVDRGNPAVASYYQTYHPALFRLIRYVAQEFSARGKPVGVCGELGGDPPAAAVLMGLGLRQLSMGASSVAGIKQMVCSVRCADAAALAEKVCGLSTADEVKQYLAEQIRL